MPTAPSTPRTAKPVWVKINQRLHALGHRGRKIAGCLQRQGESRWLWFTNVTPYKSGHAADLKAAKKAAIEALAIPAAGCFPTR